MANPVTVSRFVRGGKIGDNDQAARVISNVIDFALLNVDANAVVGALKLDAGTVVLTCGVKVLTAEGGVATADVGDTDTANTYLATVNLNDTATDVGDELAAPVYYKAEDHITVKVSAACDHAKIYVWALVANIHGNS